MAFTSRTNVLRSTRSQFVVLGLLPLVVLSFSLVLIAWARLGWPYGINLAVATLIVDGFIASFGLRVTRRLEHLHARARAFAQGAPFGPPVGGNDEIADLDDIFTSVASSARQRESTLGRYRVLSDYARDAICFSTRSHAVIVEVNQAMEDLYGYSREELIGMNWRRLRGPEASDLFDEQAGIVQPDTVFYETLHMRSDGSVFPVEIVAQSAIVGGEHVVLSIMRDITERRKADAALRSALTSATEASRLKSAFVATMSHEIRTPMNGVIGMTELLLETPLSDEQREYMSVVHESGQALLRIINDILDFSKIEAGQLDLEPTDFELVSVLEGVGALLYASASAKRISLSTFGDPAFPHILVGDPGRLRQVLLNLAGNAIKFTERGGVLIGAELRDTSDERVTAHFFVRDTGVGIDARTHTTLFEPFRQGDGSTTRRFGGTGLGLAISQQIVHLMGGTIEVTSTPGVGSAFEFTIDLRRGPQPAGTTERDVLETRVLVVDDDMISRQVVSRYLSSWGFEHESAISGPHALAMLAEAHKTGALFDVVLIDLVMPGMNGFELGEALRSDERFCAARRVLITAFDAGSQGTRAIAAGFAGYLVKPLRQSQLLDCIVNVTERTEELVSVRMAEQPRAAQHSGRVLVAEDNAVNQRLAQRQLERLGYEVDVVATGREALEQTALHDYDAVLMDCQMSEMDGYEATRAIRHAELRTGRHVPIIAMTANALSEDRDACLAAGMDDYVAKPVKLTMLREALARWTARMETPVLDRAHLADIFRDDVEGLEAFLQQAVRELGRVKDRLLFSESMDDRLALAHELKGAAANAGACELAAITTALEHTLKQPAVGATELTERLEAVAAAYGRLVDASHSTEPTGALP